LTVNVNNVAGYYIPIYTGDTTGLTPDNTRVFWGVETNDVALSSSGFVSMTINATTYYIPIYTGATTPICHSNLNGVLDDTATFTTAGFVAINVNGSTKLTEVYTKS
jgi:hypothetical protein